MSESTWDLTGTPPHWKPFALQLAEWTVAVVLSRVICGLVVSRMTEHADLVMCMIKSPP